MTANKERFGPTFLCLAQIQKQCSATVSEHWFRVSTPWNTRHDQRDEASLVVPKCSNPTTFTSRKEAAANTQLHPVYQRFYLEPGVSSWECSQSGQTFRWLFSSWKDRLPLYSLPPQILKCKSWKSRSSDKNKNEPHGPQCRTRESAASWWRGSPGGGQEVEAGGVR